MIWLHIQEWKLLYTMATELTIIIPTYKRHASLERICESVDQYRPSSSEVIVVDQSPDSKEIQSLFRKKYPYIIYMCLPGPGLPKARNEGILKSSGDIILFVDDDAIMHPNCFREHITLHSQSGINAIAGRVVQMNANVSWAETTTVATIDPETGETTGNFDLDYKGDVPYATGGHMSIKRDVFKKTGLFNPRYIGNALFEDVDFFCRMRNAGYTVRYNMNAIIYHYHATHWQNA